MTGNLPLRCWHARLSQSRGVSIQAVIARLDRLYSLVEAGGARGKANGDSRIDIMTLSWNIFHPHYHRSETLGKLTILFTLGGQNRKNVHIIVYCHNN